jgi:hypothetical protein
VVFGDSAKSWYSIKKIRWQCQSKILQKLNKLCDIQLRQSRFYWDFNTYYFKLFNMNKFVHDKKTFFFEFLN